jgi:LPXTG-site transpeptidase (sortase) family protein
MKHIWSKISVIVGILLIAAGIYLFHLRDSNALMNDAPTAPPVAAQHWVAPKPTTIEGNPVHITIPSLVLSLDIINGTYNTHTQQWTLTKDKVQYAVMTPPPNDAGGDTFLYGHYRTGVFATLHNLKIGDQVSITTDNGHTFTYQLASVRVTDPTDASLFSYTGKPILTIQTCTGLFFQYRQLFTFNLVGVN